MGTKVGKSVREPLKLGTHMSPAKGLRRMGKDALSIDANTLQFFLRNPRGTRAKALDPADYASFRALMKDNAFAPVVAHAPYTLNLCSADPHLRDLSESMLAEDLERLQHLPGNYYNLHPGSHVGQGPETAIPMIAAAVNRNLVLGHESLLLLETMSGKGSEVGRTFAEIAAVIERIELSEKIGVCFDACHLFAAGYDIVNRLDAVLDEFDAAVGLQRLKAFHLNDSLDPLGSHKDRHTTIGDGCIGYEAVVRIVTHPRLRHLSFITETPLDLAGHSLEIARLRRLFAQAGTRNAQLA